jgi:hypothetical protein
MKESEEAEWTFLADTPRDQAEIGRLRAYLAAARHDAEILRETIRQARSRLEAYYSEVNAGRMPIDRLMATCNIDTLFEEAKMIPYEAARQDAERMRAELVNVIILLKEAQSGYIPGCGGDMEWQRSRDVAIKDARAAIQGVAIKAPRP